MKSNTKIENQLSKKRNIKLVETIIAAKKEKNWKVVAEILSGTRKNQVEISIQKINEEAGEKSVIIVPGKVLSQGDLNKKIKIAAFSFSDKAKEKILNAHGEIISLIDEIKKNPKAEGVKILK